MSEVRVDPRLDPKLVLSLAAVYVIWGSTYYAMSVAVVGLPPMLMGAMRFIAAGAILQAIARWQGAPRASMRQILETIPIGILFFIGGVVLIGGSWKGGDPLYFTLLVLSPLSWAIGSILARRLPGPGGASGSALQMLTGGIALLLVALVRGERFPEAAPLDAWLAV